MAQHDGRVTGSNSVQPPIIPVKVGDTVKWEGAGGKKIKIYDLPPTACDPDNSGPVHVNNFITTVIAPIPQGEEEYSASLEGSPKFKNGRPRLENET